MTTDNTRQDIITSRQASSERIPIAISAFLSALSLLVALVFSFLPDGATLSHLFIVATTFFMLPPSWLIQRDLTPNQRTSRVRYAGIWITVLILDAGFLVITLQNLENWDIATTLIHLFFLGMTFIGFWFILSGTITLFRNSTPVWLGVLTITSGLLWVLMNLFVEINTFLPQVFENMVNSLPYISLAWGTVHLIWAIGNGIWILKSYTGGAKLK